MKRGAVAVLSPVQFREMQAMLISEPAKRVARVSDRAFQCLYEQRIAESRLEQVLSECEAVLVEPQCRAVLDAVVPLVQPATLVDVKACVATLLAAFPTGHDLRAFVPIVVGEILAERPQRLQLIYACRELRRTKNFRPSLAEILEELPKHKIYEAISIASLPGRPAALRQKLAHMEMRRLNSASSKDMEDKGARAAKTQ